ncbi:MAG TPA: hypothetical protein VGM14_05970 [Streptosporangiaceae bacterium]
MRAFRSKFYGLSMTADHIYTIAGTGSAGYSGDGIPASSTELFIPADVSFDRTGNLVITDFGNNRLRMTTG